MINWWNLLLVLGVTLVGSLAAIGIVGLGIRLLAMPTRPGKVGEERDEENDEVNLVGRPRIATAFAIVCFAAFAAIVVYGIYLMIPALN